MCKCDCATFKEHIQGINFAPSTRTGSGELRTQLQKEKKMSADHAAYKRLKRDGLQPKTVGGAAQIEQADSAYEIQKGKLLTKPEQTTRKLVETVMADTGIGKAATDVVR